MITPSTLHKDCKPAAVKAEIKKIDKPIDASDAAAKRAQVKIRVHLVCITIAGIISFALYANHIGTPILNSFGPIFPSVIQELLDRIKHI